MRYLKYLALLAICMFPAALPSHAQRVVVGVGVGPAYGYAPVCEYGYYGYYPYACAPYGYYGPDYFVSGVFIGAGPWFHGSYGRPGFYGRGYYGRGYYGRGFYGRDFDRDRGFRGRDGFEHRGFDRGGFRGGMSQLRLTRDGRTLYFQEGESVFAAAVGCFVKASPSPASPMTSAV